MCRSLWVWQWVLATIVVVYTGSLSISGCSLLCTVCVQVSCGRGSGSDVVGGDGGEGDERKGVQDSTSL